MAGSSPKAQGLGGKPHFFCQRVEDNAFHLIESEILSKQWLPRQDIDAALVPSS
jgi:hypothetical protein